MCKVKQQTEIEKIPELHETENPDSDDDSDDSQDGYDSEEMTDTDDSHHPPLSPESIKQIDVNLMKLIVKSLLPVRNFILEGFAQFLRALNAGYVMPTRNDITKRILPEMFRKCLEEQKIFVQENAEAVCLTLDRWESLNEEPLMSIVAHFITSDFQYKSVLLKVTYCDLNPNDLKTVLSETCTEWGIAGTINCCVSNSMPQRGNDEWTASAINSSGWDHIDCVGYKFNAVFDNCFKSCSDIIISVKNIVDYFESSLKSRLKMEEYQVKEGITEPLELIYPEDFNWSCKYDMLERFVLLKEPLEAVLAEQTDINLPGITNEGWTQLEQILKLLKPFREATREMVTDKYVAASKVIPIVNGLKQELHKTPNCYNLVKNLINCVDREMNEQFNGIESNRNLVMCTILDPRYKTSMFLNKNTVDTAKSNLVSEVEALMKVGTGSMGPVKTDGGLNKAIDDDLFNQTVNYRLACKEVESYLLEELADEDKALPSTWWQNNKSKFPHVAKLFQTRCNYIATSMSMEYIFTETGIQLYCRRKALSLRKAALILFLNHNLKDDDYFRLLPESYHNVMD